MAKTINVFDFEMNISGAAIVAAGNDGNRSRLSSRCLSDGEVDGQIRLLKADLDAVAIRMKKAIREQAKKPIF